MLYDRLIPHYEELLINYYDVADISIEGNKLKIADNESALIKLYNLCKSLPKEPLINHMETILIYGKQRKIPFNLLILVDEYQENLKKDFFIDIEKEYTHYKFSIFHKAYDYLVFSFIENHTNELEIKEKLNEFLYKEIKLPDFVIKKVENDLKNLFLSGFGIDFSKYIFELTLFSKQDQEYMAIFTNTDSGKQIVIQPIQMSEQTGDVYFAGKYESFLRL